MAGDVNHQAAPGESRLVFNMNSGEGKSVRRDLDELKKSFEAVKNSQRRWSGEFRASGRDIERVAFFFDGLLDGIAGVVRMNDDCRFCGIAETLVRGNAGFVRKVREKAKCAGFEEGIVAAINGDGEGIVNQEPASAHLEVRGQRSEIGHGGLVLRGSLWDE